MIPTVNGVPILLPGHCDDFGNPEFHYHVDWRYHPGEVKQNYVIYSSEEVVYRDLEPVRKVVDVVGQCPLVNIMLAHRYKGHVAECGKCPHHGLPLQSNGKCPGHGLSVKPDGTVDSELYYEVEGIRLPASLQNRPYCFTMVGEGIMSHVSLINSQGIVLSKMPLQRVPYTKGDMLRLSVNNNKA